MLGPEGALHTVVGFAGNGLVVGGAHVVGAVACAGRILGRVALLAVDVVGSPGGVDVLQSEFGGLLGGSFGAGPAIDEGTGALDGFGVGIACGDSFVPDGELAALGLDEVGHFLDEVALELAVVGESELFVAGLALGVVFPCGGGALVAADVDGLVGEDVHELLKDVLGELHGFGVGYVEDVAGDAARGPDGVVAVGVAAVFGIGGHGGYEVAGHVDFGHDFDVALTSVGHDVAELVLGVEVGAVGLVDPVLGAGVHVGEHAVGGNAADGGELGVLLDFHAPALVIAEVPVEAVHLVVGHEVNHALDVFDGEEVARNVEHEAAVLEAGLVVDGDER